MGFAEDWKSAKSGFDSAFDSLTAHAKTIEAELKKYKGRDDKIGAALKQTFKCPNLEEGDSQKLIKKDLDTIKKFNRKKSQGVSSGLRKVEGALKQLEDCATMTTVNIDDYAKKRRTVQKDLDNWQKALKDAIKPIVEGLEVQSKSIEKSKVEAVNYGVSKIKGCLRQISVEIRVKDQLIKNYFDKSMAPVAPPKNIHRALSYPDQDFSWLKST